MAAHRLVLTMMGLTILIATGLAAALADFGGQGLDRAVHKDLASAAGTSVDVSGSVTASQEAPGTSAIRSAARSAFGRVPFALYGAIWSGALDLPTGTGGTIGAGGTTDAGGTTGPRGTRSVPQVQAASLSSVARA